MAEIGFAGWTREKLLRQARFEGLRQDKRSRDVLWEPALRPAASRLKLSHPDRIFYPEANLAKRDLAAYYASAAERILPHIAGRPLALLRCPEGREGECFFQKHLPSGFPPSI